MRLALRLVIPGAIAALTLAACATNATTPTPAPATGAATASAAQGNAVTIKGFAFLPANLTVAKGTTVTFTNQDSATHTVTSGAGRTKDGRFDDQVGGGEVATVTFDTPGVYEYFCTIHASMKGTVTVR